MGSNVGIVIMKLKNSNDNYEQSQQSLGILIVY